MVNGRIYNFEITMRFILSACLLLVIFFSSLVSAANYCNETNFDKNLRYNNKGEAKVSKVIDLYNDAISRKPNLFSALDKNVNRMARFYMFGTKQFDLELKQHEDNIDEIVQLLEKSLAKTESAKEYLYKVLGNWHKIRNSCMRADGEIENANVAQGNSNITQEYIYKAKDMEKLIVKAQEIYVGEQKFLQAGKLRAVEMKKELQ